MLQLNHFQKSRTFHCVSKLSDDKFDNQHQQQIVQRQPIIILRCPLEVNGRIVVEKQWYEIGTILGSLSYVPCTSVPVRLSVTGCHALYACRTSVQSSHTYVITNNMAGTSIIHHVASAQPTLSQ
eukprot:468993_1